MYLMKRLFYIRHGQTIANINNIFGGHSETSLSELGKNQAKKAGADAKTNLPKVDVIISSPLSRAYDTAKLVANRHHMSGGDGADEYWNDYDEYFGTVNGGEEQRVEVK